MKYFNYSASYEFSPEDRVFYGNICGITDLVTFEAESVQELELAFQRAVDDYLESGQDMNKVPEKPSDLT